ncbi:hypothetical protein RAH32_20635 [Paracoccus sp. WLY502]|uniref:hypothetical protein n=1 Tax=Paracoccus yibinensis TaxID=3068891 RepID=UPI0027965305|nr:hypothetical protein [Paracoccus sp. WLY502]MDQ1902826.1 hypothetical protein [Paracoccus sp. WLY502]
MAKMKIKELPNYDLIRRLHMSRIKQINDFFIEVELTIDALKSFQKDMLSRDSKADYSVPKMNGGVRTVKRNTSEVLNYIDHRIAYSQYAQSLVFIVARVEDYITDVLLTMLLAFPRKILISIKGNESSKNVDLKTIIEKNDIDTLIFDQAKMRINEALYASPKQYADYFTKVCGFDLGPHLQNYIEMKATRDLLVHSEGVVNAIYLEKAGELARGKNGEIVPIDAEYFESSVRDMKNMSSTIYRGLLNKYGDSTEFSQSVAKQKSTS